MATLQTERLRLRMFRADDLDAYAAMCADPEVMRYLGGKPFSRLESWRHLAMILGHWELRHYGMWAVEERLTGQFVGRIGLIDPEGWPGFELGWALARRHWGKGLATEGARAALSYAFSVVRRDHVISLIHPDNHASIRVAQRLGERLEGETDLLGARVQVYGIHRTGVRV
jgi:RimJ/RimL family protein N-acetyltransferase